MHSAPSVNYPVGRSRAARRLLVTLWTLGVASAAFAALQTDDIDWRLVLIALSVIGAGAAAWSGMRRSAAPAVLDFDGRQWSILGAGRPLRMTQARVVLDFQSLMLLSFESPAHPRRWVWVDRQSMSAGWSELRRALYSRLPTTAVDADVAKLHQPDA